MFTALITGLIAPSDKPSAAVTTPAELKGKKMKTSFWGRRAFGEERSLSNCGTYLATSTESVKPKHWQPSDSLLPEPHTQSRDPRAKRGSCLEIVTSSPFSKNRPQQTTATAPFTLFDNLSI